MVKKWANNDYLVLRHIHAQIQAKKTVKNAIFKAFYGILRRKMILNDDGLACIYA